MEELLKKQTSLHLKKIISIQLGITKAYLFILIKIQQQHELFIEIEIRNQNEKKNLKNFTEVEYNKKIKL